jgi:hypothetical protein
MRKTFFAFAAMAFALSARAQEPTPTPDQASRGTWTANLPGGTYIVGLSAITSVSIHDYVVDGAARVSEVNVSALGSEAVRFYYIEPNTPQAPDGVGQSAINLIKEKAQDAISRGGGDDVWMKVVKNYPTTTHAHTVEYRLPTRESLQKLFESVKDSWTRRRAGAFKP